MPKVCIWRDGAIEAEFNPGHRDWRVGRSETNDITLLDPRKSVSRFHAELREKDGRWVFIDLNSQNGSWKDGQRINRLFLEHGHEVLFGDYKLVFEDPAPPPSAMPAEATTITAPGMEEDAAADIPEPTVLVPGVAPTPLPPLPPVPASGAAPVVRPAVNPPLLRKGVNPIVVMAVFLVLLLLTLAVLASRLLANDESPAATHPLSPPVPAAVVAPLPSPTARARASIGVPFLVVGVPAHGVAIDIPLTRPT